MLKTRLRCKNYQANGDAIEHGYLEKKKGDKNHFKTNVKWNNCVE